ncbi:bifunctional adenosylcobinamide kinase/adenosylcobinamide-phosphate guanylyltransferase [Desulfosporosinus sp. PR]|uniref:bifunctional adenosylcobinamide kinase/adenosylcobinamide-phosphate guanylyltransferase n=1 Tax=Candidatus Desulfosporosinus nitrosoreducens TaxID=3401928 RepID=UPI0027ED4AB9|nr:bifunctional adenosylcobinamide kinase/adenosylcobinamide-phosphate guanylyltransferase [Desulfosporosinus sp. PR]MDQ7097065.1 bifunctional adenosylcobinamide kinase/adenosylcobinamide-phosphate guanylyltransferase [Desulfosporosinus sp. PR]
MSQFTLITGGSRSGKSSFAELLAAHTALPDRPVTYIATAQIWDEEMAYRVKKHQQQRPASWQLIEEPLNIRDILLQLSDKDGVILLDCVTLWLTNLLLAEQTDSANNTASPAPLNDHPMAEQVEPKILSIVQETALLAKEIKPQVIFVTNEVGQGIVPDNPLARTYRDLAGKSNQILAQYADKVYWVLAGLPMEIKRSGEALLSSLRKE